MTKSLIQNSGFTQLILASCTSVKILTPHSITNQEDARKESIEAETEPRDPETVDKLVRVEHAVKKAVDKCNEILNKLKVGILGLT